MQIEVKTEKIQTNSLYARQGIYRRPARQCVCIYYMEATCTLPQLQFNICRHCPRAARYVSKNVVTSIFNYVKGTAIFLLSSLTPINK